MLKIRVYSKEVNYNAAEVSESALCMIKRMNAYPKGFSPKFKDESILVVFNNYDSAAIEELKSKDYLKEIDGGIYEYYRLVDNAAYAASI